MKVIVIAQQKIKIDPNWRKVKKVPVSIKLTQIKEQHEGLEGLKVFNFATTPLLNFTEC